MTGTNLNYRTRDIQKVLERWGAWAASGNDNVDYAPIAAGFKNLLPSTRKARVSCSDDDGLLISGAMTLLKKQDPYLCRLLELYYIQRATLRGMEAHLGISRNLVSARLLKAEGFIDGCLSALGVPLEMD
ncbi:antitermination protein [Salmonella enterica subsp. enterica serovar Legon]|nr:antitermination protein [Salmonella enterica subsp. enterica serovar Legon]